MSDLLKGFIRNMPEAEYHADPGLNASTLKCPTARDMRAAKSGERSVTPAQLAAFAQGSATHKAVLERHRFEADIHVVGTKTLTSKEAAEAREAMPQKIVLTEEMREIALRQADMVWQHEQAAEYLGASQDFEVSAFVDDEDGQRLKARIDCRPPTGANFLLDVKTVQGPSINAFLRSVENFHYDLQAAFYLYVDQLVGGEGREEFAFLLVSKAPPYHVRMCLLTNEYLEHGREQMHQQIDVWKQAKELCHWAGYEKEGVRIIDKPRWSKPIYED